MSKKKIVIIVACLAVVTALLIVAALYVNKKKEWEDKYQTFLSADCFFDHVTIDDVDVSGLSSKEATERLLEQYDREVAVSFGGKKLGVFHYMDMPSYEEKLLAAVTDIESGQNITVDTFRTGEYAINESIDAANLFSFDEKDVSNLSILQTPVSSSVEACIVYDESLNEYTVEEGSEGLMINPQKFVALVNETVKNEQTEILLSSSDLISYYDEEKDSALYEEAKLRNQKLNKMISISVCGVWEVIGPERIKDFYDLESFTLLEERVDDFIAGLKRNYDTYNSIRLFTTATGAEVEIPGGNYGWCIHAAKTKEALLEAFFSEDEDAEMEAVYSAYGLRPVNNELSNTYVEISLERQHIWMFVDGAMVISDDCTTGDIQSEQFTNRGMFRLTYKKEACNLRVDTDYFFVNYWMPFDGGIGMHDATWRTYEQFGGTNYLDGNGSHGCINLRLETAQKIYELIQSDTPIIVW